MAVVMLVLPIYVESRLSYGGHTSINRPAPIDFRRSWKKLTGFRKMSLELENI